MRIHKAALAGTMPDELAKLARPDSGLADMIKAIGGAEPGIVLHCVAGRDRTGFIVAVLLAAVGVRDDDIVADYVASDLELEEEYVRFIAEHADDEADIREAIARREETMRVMLATLRADYGDGAAYLRASGVGAAEIGTIRAKLLT
jgi:protein-tyrosine phosphatase